MIDPKGRLMQTVLHIAPFLTFLITIVLCTVVFQSYAGYFPPPVAITNLSGRLVADERSTVLAYERLAAVRIAVTSTTSRRLTCAGHWVYDLGTTDTEHLIEDSGVVNAHNEKIPFRLAPGTVCVLKTTAVYHPPLSLRGHTYPVPDLILTVTEKDKP